MSAARRLFPAASITVIVLCPIFAMAGAAWTSCEADANLVGHSFDNGYVMGASQYLYSCGSYAGVTQYYTDHNFVTDENGDEDYPFYLGANASAYANAAPGFNRASASASSSNTPMAYLYTDPDGNSQALNNNDWVWSQAEASSAWRDQITITSGSLPKGTPVTLQTTFELHVAAGGNPTFANNDTWNEQISLSGLGWPKTLPPGWTFSWYPTAHYSFWTNASGCAANGICAPTVLVLTGTAYVGTTYTIGASLSGSVLAVTGMYGGDPFVSNASEFWNASSTGIYELDVLTPGASFVSGSGYNYSATPEPGTLLLLGSGLAAVAGAIRRKLS